MSRGSWMSKSSTPEPSGAPEEIAPPIASRRDAREAAYQAMYAVTVGNRTPTEVLTELKDATNFEAKTWAFLKDLVHGTASDADRWDACFAGHLTSAWPLERLAATDRNALRMACYELWALDDMPPKVTISEYMHLAQRFGGEESGRFVHGILATVLKNSPKANWTPPTDMPGGEQTDIPPAPEVVAVEPGTIRPEPSAPVWVLRHDDEEDS